MDELKILLDEKQKFELAHLEGKEYDLSKLREVATELSKKAPKTFPFNVNGTDEELMTSIVEAEKKYRP